MLNGPFDLTHRLILIYVRIKFDFVKFVDLTKSNTMSHNPPGWCQYGYLHQRAKPGTRFCALHQRCEPPVTPITVTTPPGWCQYGQHHRRAKPGSRFCVLHQRCEKFDSLKNFCV